MSPTLAQLRYLVAVADSRSITAAAEALFVAQPALSRAVQAMERELGVDLLSRQGRGVELTQEGARVVRLARTVLAAVEAIEDIGTAAAGATLHVVATPTLTLDLADYLVPAFMERHPGTDVRLHQQDSREALVEALLNGSADLGLVDLPVDGRLAAHHVQEREVVLVSPPDTRLPDPIPLDRLDGLPLVLPTPGTGRRTEFEAMFGRLQVRPVPSLEIDERLAWVTHVAEGHGSLIWYRDLALRAFGKRAQIRSFRPLLLRQIGIVHARQQLSPAARDFIAHARQKVPAREPTR